MQGIAILVLVNFLSLNFFMSPPQSIQKCLPADMKATEVIAIETKNSKAGDVVTKKITVKDQLNEIKARCQKGKLVDGSGREIRFYRLAGCWGNPPADYLEILERQQNEINELKKHYRVIEIPCNVSPDSKVIH
jgi:hypothetical protein